MRSSIMICLSLLLSGCFSLEGEPASQKEVLSGLLYNTVKEDVSFEGYRAVTYTFHRPDGLASFFEQINTSKGYTRETRVGNWSAQPGQVCYKWKESSSCKKVNISEGKTVAEHGDIRPRDIGGTQRRNRLNVIEPPRIANAKSISDAIASNPKLAPGLAILGKYVETADKLGKSGGTRTYQCKVHCDDVKNKVPFSVSGTSYDNAYSQASRLIGQVCKPFGGTAFLEFLECQ